MGCSRQRRIDRTTHITLWHRDDRHYDLVTWEMEGVTYTELVTHRNITCKTKRPGPFLILPEKYLDTL